MVLVSWLQLPLLAALGNHSPNKWGGEVVKREGDCAKRDAAVPRRVCAISAPCAAIVAKNVL